MNQQPDPGPDRETTAREHESAGRSREAAEIWGELATRRPVGASRAAALVERARLEPDPERAALLYRRALVNDPANAAAHEALAVRARETADWPLLANLYRLRFTHEGSPAACAAIALEAGRLERDRLRSPGAARSWFRDGLECDPSRLEIADALVDLERRRGDEAAVLVTLERLIELRGDGAAASELLEAATLRAARGEHARALAHLERASARAPEDALVLEALAEVLAALDRLQELADVLERRAAIAADDPEVRAGVLAELGTLFEERLFDPEAALEAFERAAADDPRAPGVRDAITRLRAKLESDGGAAPHDRPAEAGADAQPASGETLAKLEREARTTNDRARLGALVRDIESLHRRRGTPGAALPWVQRWAVAAPEDPEALRALARIHQTPGHEAELAATLEALDPLLDFEEQAANRRQLAALYESRGRLDDAVRAYERALLVEPRDLETLRSLESLLRDRADVGALIGVLQRILELCEPRSRVECLLDIAELQEESGDIAGAIATRERLENEETAPADAEERLDALLELAGRLEEIEARLRRRRERFDPGSAEWVALELHRAQILLQGLERPDDAARAFRGVLAHAPESPEAKTGLERALRSSIDAEGLAEFLAQRAREIEDPVQRDRAALERAVLLDEVLERRDEAREAYRSLAADATEPELRDDACFRYERLLQRGGEWERLREHFEARVARAEPAEAASLHERLARLCAEQLRDEAGELSHLERVVALDPGRVDVWRTLAERYEQDERFDDLIRAMEQELRAGCEAARALTLHARLADLHLRLRGDTAAAREHYERVFELDPSHAAAAQFLIGRYDRDRRPEEVIRVLESRLAALEGDPEAGEAATSHRTALRVHIASVRADQQGDVDGAISALEMALGESGPVPQVAEPLAACYQRAGYTIDLIELARSAASACSDPTECANWFVRMGDAFLARERPREAADAFRQALTERPDDRAVQASLREIYRQLDEAAPLVSLLDAELAHLAGPDEVPVRLELAELLSCRLERPADALLHLQRVLQLSPRHPEAFCRAIALAETLERHEAALDLIETRLDYANTGDERALLLARRAELLAGPFDRTDEAIESLRASLTVRHDDSRRERLAALLEREARHAEWIEVIGEQARDAEPERRAVLFELAARAAAEHLSPDASLPWLERLAALRRDDVEVLLRVAQVHRAAGRTESLLRALSGALERTHNPMQRRNLQLERAALLELELSAPGRALQALEDARSVAPMDPEVLGRLERLQAALSRDADRAETLEVLLVVSPEDAFELHCELARLRAGPLHDPAGAVAHWRSALDHPSAREGRARTEILRSLAETYRRAGDLESWARTAEEELAALDAAPVFDDRRREIRRELVLGYHDLLARPDDALRHARALLDAGEDDLLGSETLDRIESITLVLLRQAGAPVELEARLTRHLARRPRDVSLWLELARVREEQLQSTSAAIDAYRRALELDPHCLSALRGLRSAAERLGRHQDVADALERELEHPDTVDPEARSALLRRLGDVYWHRLQSTTRASRSYAAALEVNGADFAALRALERLLEAMEDWRGALDLYESEAQVLSDGDPARRRQVWLRVAAIARDRTDDVARARRAMDRAAAIEPLDALQLRELSELHARAGDDAAFVETFSRWCDDEGASPTPEDHLRLATCLDRQGRTHEALDRVERAIDSAPQTPDAWDLAARLREAQGDPAGAAEALRGAAERAPDREAAERLVRASRCVEATAPGSALALLREAVTRDPAAIAAWALRTHIALRAGKLAAAEEAAAAALDLDVDGALEPAERLEIALCGGDAARAAGRLETAAGFYGRARDCDPSDPRASGRFGETLAELGDTARAREALEARIAVGDEYPERASHRATLALCFEAEGDLEAALDAALLALADDPRDETALGACVRIHESLGHVEEVVEATLRWAAAAEDGARRARRLQRAAEWELRSGEHEEAAERHLRDALAADADLPSAWILLASLLSGQGRFDDAIACADRAGSHVTREEDLGTLALIQGRAHELRGDRNAAAEAFGVAAEADPRCAEAALSQARLLRGAGEWRAAAAALASFLAGHPEPDSSDLGPVHEQLARLLAGPLEDVDGAIESYRRAIVLAPDLLAPRAALAGLLSHRSGDHDEALAHLRDLLDADPTDAASLRAALRLARANPGGNGPGTGLEVLRALGLASAYEREEAREATLPAPPAALAHPLYDLLRRVAQLSAEPIAEALEASASEASESPDAPGPDAPEAAFRDALARCEGRLAAPALVPLPTRELSEVMLLVLQLTVDPEAVRGDGRLVNRLSSALKRRQRRRLRKEIGDVPVAELCDVDFADWRTELHALAALQAMAETGCSLRTALVSVVREDAEGRLDAAVREQANLAPRVCASPVARAVLRRLLGAWLERILP